MIDKHLLILSMIDNPRLILNTICTTITGHNHSLRLRTMPNHRSIQIHIILPASLVVPRAHLYPLVQLILISLPPIHTPRTPHSRHLHDNTPHSTSIL